MVRSAPRYENLSQLCRSVSIPRWFDQHAIAPARSNFGQKCFNSTMVRSAPGLNTTPPPQIMTFQFHDGSISTANPYPAGRAGLAFQFHDGSISTRRLWNCLLMFFLFQFHDGSISTGQALSTWRFRKRVSIPRWFDQHSNHQLPGSTTVAGFQFHDGSISTMAA